MHKYLKMKIVFVLFILLCDKSSGVLYSISETTYRRMPALYHLDDYDGCLLESPGVYCLVDADLHSKEPSDLMDLIQNYSDYSIKHFNHTQIHRGVCLTETCKNFLPKAIYQNRTEEAQNGLLVECLNETMWNEYRLQVNRVNVRYCESHHQTDDIDGADVAVAVIYIVIIMLNVIGSFCDIRSTKTNIKDNAFLSAFSVFRNWKRLVAPSGAGPDPRLARLKSFNGFRTITIICVFFSHTALIMAYSYIDNPLYIEKSYDDPMKQILYNGSLVTFTFFTMSSFLLAYNLERQAETTDISWTLIPKGIVIRWLRLTPSYALVIATICTWMRHLGEGPLWRHVVTSETLACRQYWWAHLLYINNYVYKDSFCFPQTWYVLYYNFIIDNLMLPIAEEWSLHWTVDIHMYLAADTQLFFLGLILCVVCRTPRSRRVMLGVMMVLSLVIPAVQTYMQDLDAVVMQTPESYREIYTNSATFRYLYVSAHGNLASYTLGLAGGFLAFRWQNSGLDVNKYKSHRWMYWLLFPLGVAVILSGGLFYIDGEPVPLVYRVVYAMLYKALFQFFVVAIVLGTIFKMDTVYRKVVEWRGWTWTGRVSYAGFLLHTLLQRGFYGSQRQLIHLSDYNVMFVLSSTIFLTFVIAAIFWILVEAPLCQLTKLAMAPRATSEGRMKKNVTIATVEAIGSQSKL